MKKKYLFIKMLLFISATANLNAELLALPQGMPNTSQLQGLTNLNKSSDNNNDSGQDYSILDYQNKNTMKNFYIGLEVGLAQISKPRQFSISPNNGASASGSQLNDNPTTPNFLIGLDGGYGIPTGQRWLPEYYFGLAYNYYAQQTFTGTLDNSATNSKYFTYNSGVTSQTLLATTQLDIVNFYSLRPFIRLGVGAARNKLLAYQFGDNSSYWAISAGQPSYNLAYQAAAGLNYHLDRFSFSIFYSYTHLGSVTSGIPEWPIRSTGSSFSRLNMALNSSAVTAEIRYFI